MADKPIREQSALELLETHAKALEQENERLRDGLRRARDACLEVGAPITASCIDELLESSPDETAGCREHAAWEHVKALQCPVCKELRPAVETAAKPPLDTDDIERLAREHFCEVHGIPPVDQWPMMPEEVKESYRQWIRNKQTELAAEKAAAEPPK